jgi:LAO/AO transport system kinase
VTAETIEGMAAQIRGGDRRALARAITLVESRRADHREKSP